MLTSDIDDSPLNPGTPPTNKQLQPGGRKFSEWLDVARKNLACRIGGSFSQEFQPGVCGGI